MKSIKSRDRNENEIREKVHSCITGMKGGYSNKEDRRKYYREYKKSSGVPIKRYLEIEKEIRRKREIRSERKPGPQPDLNQRFFAHLKRIGIQEIRRRVLGSPAGWSTNQDAIYIADYSAKDGVWVLSGEYFYHYSNRVGDWRVGASFFCGRDDNGQYFAVRIPKNIKSIEDAIEYITPAAVRKAKEVGRWVGRQGDVYLVELKSGKNNLLDLPASHTLSNRILQHDEHDPVSLPNHVHTVRAYIQKSVSGAAAD